MLYTLKPKIRKYFALFSMSSLNFPLIIPTSKTLPFQNSKTQYIILQNKFIYLITPPRHRSLPLEPWMMMARESNPGKIILHHPLTAKQVVDDNLIKFLSYLNLNEYKVSRLVQGYNLKHTNNVQKVLLCSPTNSSSLELIVLYYKGVVAKLTVKVQEDCQDTCLQLLNRRSFRFRYLDDVTNEYENMLCGVDRKGCLYKLDVASMDVERELVSGPSLGSDYSRRRKRLVVDVTLGKLYMVVRKNGNDEIGFKIYKHNKSCNQWDVVQHLGCGRVLFVGVEHCFFAKVEDFPGCKGDCIVFAANCFRDHYGLSASDYSLFGDTNTEVGVYEMGKGYNFSLLSFAYPDFSRLIWPPPTWIIPKRNIGNGKSVLICSSTKLVLPSEPSCCTPWIVRSVEIGDKTGLFDPLSGDSLPNISQYVFLDQFNSQYLAVHYHIANVNGNDFPNSLFEYGKVLPFYLSGDQSLPIMVQDCYLLILSAGGKLAGSKPVLHRTENESARFGISYGSIGTFDDILHFKGINYAVDKLGKLYRMSPTTFGELEIVVSEPIVKKHSASNIWRKRLVGSQWDEELYMVVRDDLEDELEIYRLFTHTNKKSWIKVHTFGDDQVLILCHVYGFFILAKELLNCPQLQNCIFFYDAFTPFTKVGKRPSKKLKGEKEIQVFWLGADHQIFKPISSYPGFPAANFFSPPKWFLQVYPDSLASYRKRVYVSKFAEQQVFNSNSKLVTPTLQDCENCSSTVKFEGVNIKSVLVPTLRVIWDKHGSPVGENTVRSNDMKACALESMAKLVITLRNTIGRSLTDSQLHDIRLILDDLKRVGLNVHWLDHVVEKARKLQESKRASKIKLLKEEKALLSAKVSFLEEPIDLDEYLLGSGL